MKHLRSKIILVLVLAALMIAGCGGKDESTEQPSETENLSLNQTEENQEAETESVTELETEISTEVEETESEIPSETTEDTSSSAETDSTVENNSTAENNSNGGQSTTENNPPATTYEEFPYELYVATFDGQYFTFYHDQTHGGYGEGWDSINAQVQEIANTNPYGYPGGTTYYGDWRNETVEEMGRYKNTGKYVTGETMNVVCIRVPFVVELPSAYALLNIDQIEEGGDDITFYYIEGISDFNSLKAQADAKAEAYCQAGEAESPGVDYITTTSNTYINTYQEGKVYQYRCSMSVNMEQ